MDDSNVSAGDPAPVEPPTGWRHHVHRYGGDLRLLSLSMLVGVAAGLGALLFKAALDVCTRLLLVDIGGYSPATTIGEGGGTPASSFARPF